MNTTQSTSMPIPDGTPFQFGDQTFTFGRDVRELDDSSPLLPDFGALRDKMARDGYLFIRGFHPRDLVEKAHQSTLEAIRQRGGLKDGTNEISDSNQNFGFFRDIAISRSPEVLAVTDGAHTVEFYEHFLGGPIAILDKHWLRAMARGGSNHFHYDSAYVGRGTFNRYTMWSAFSDIDLHNGPLVICLGSHRDKRLKSTYGATDMDRDLTDAVFSADAREMVDKFGFTLGTAHFQPGDVILFGLHMMHSSAPNQSNRYRISIDTRYQLASEPLDERFIGKDGNWIGNFSNKEAHYTPMQELRAKWGLN